MIYDCDLEIIVISFMVKKMSTLNGTNNSEYWSRHKMAEQWLQSYASLMQNSFATLKADNVVFMDKLSNGNFRRIQMDPFLDSIKQVERT